MKPSASLIFKSLIDCESLKWERRVFWETNFNVTRKRLNSIFHLLQETDDDSGESISRMARACLRPWLSVPRQFDQSLTDEVGEIDKSGISSGRWGSDVKSLYDEALTAAKKLKDAENPLMNSLLEEMSKIVRSGSTSFRIYCRTNEREWYGPIIRQVTENNPEDRMFIHTVAQYRKMDPVDVLFKVGPLKSSGYSSVPDALLNAPRFGKLLQFVWCGCDDDTDFGFDPASPIDQQDTALGHRITRSLEKYEIGNSPHEQIHFEELPDEFRTDSIESGARPAWLVTISGKLGILYRPRQQILSFDMSSGIDHRTTFETLQAGMFIIRPYYEDVDVGTSRSMGVYARAWKQKLHEEYESNREELVKILTEKGLIQKALSDSIKRWCSSIESILPAPGEYNHFIILLDALHEKGFPKEEIEKYNWGKWKRDAWVENRRAHGTAISEGFQKMEMIEGEMERILGQHSDEIREKAGNCDCFEIPIPEQNGLSGKLMFHRILSTVDGYRVGDEKIDLIQELNIIEQWRD